MGWIPIGRITEAVVFAVFVAVATVFDHARVGIHRHRRPGVLGELVRSLLFVVQHPTRTLGLALFAFALEAAVLALAVPVFRWADGGYLLTSAVVLVLVQVLVFLREALRLTHIAGAYHLRVVDEPDRSASSGAAAGNDDGDLLQNLPWNVV